MKIKIILINILIACTFINCKQETKNDATLKLITVEEMDSMLKMDQVQLIDVRTPKEYALGHIEGATNIDFNDDDFETLIKKIDKTKPIAVYCGSGGRSRRCANYMKEAGFKKIYDVDGGITEWKFKGKTVVR